MIHYVKMTFEKSSTNNFYIGAITDGHYKLTVLVTNDGEFEDDFTYGSQIKVTEKMRVPADDKPPFGFLSKRRKITRWQKNIISGIFKWISSYPINVK